jgi:cytochrome P450
VRIDTPAAARAVLEDERYTVPQADGGPPGTLAWLRAAVPRFSSGAAHAERRAVTDELVAALDPGELQAQASSCDGDATTVPVRVLAAVLGFAGDVVDHVLAVAAAYQPGADDAGSATADRAVAALVAASDDDEGPLVANRIGLLVQAAVATAALIRSVGPGTTVDDVLRDDPPARFTRRVAPDGTLVEVALGGGLAFGAGVHRCPGEAVARALAAGVLAR